MFWKLEGAVLLRTVLFLCLNIYHVASDRGYLLTLPNSMQVGVPQQICVSFHEIEHFDVNLKIDFRDVRDTTSFYSDTRDFEKGEAGCFSVTIPLSTTDSQSLVLVEGSTSFNGRSRNFDQAIADYAFKGNGTVALLKSSQITFIQPDKPIYKPGQEVKFRILTVDQTLNPVQENIAEVWVENPNGVRTAQWLDTATQSGLGDFEMQMTPEPTLGEWKINAKVRGSVTKQTFKIEEYVLPKFEVTVNAPKYVPVNADSFSVEICAKYTYGKPVQGTVGVTACIVQPYLRGGRPCAATKMPIDGCVTMTFNSADLELNSNRYSLYDAKIKFDVAVEESQTGISQTTVSETTKIETVLLKIDLSQHSPDFFKPALDYYGKGEVTRPDGSPAEGELIKVVVSSNEGQKFEKNFTTDENGFFVFTLPPFETKAYQLSVSASAVMYNFPYVPNVYQPGVPSAYLNLKRWYSRSNSFLQIEPVEEPVKCGETMSVKIRYTTPPGSHYEFHYLLISRGLIVDSGSKNKRSRAQGNMRSSESGRSPEGWSSEAEPKRLAPENPPPTEVPPTEGPEPEQTYVQSTAIAEFTLRLDVTAKMSPLAHLVVYYVREDGETVADHREIVVETCVENEVGLSLSKSQESVRPGATTDIKLTADPGSVCSLGVVDKSVHILGGDNQLNLAKVFELLKQYDLQQTREETGSNSYCSRKLGDGPGPVPGPGPIPLPLEPEIMPLEPEIMPLEPEIMPLEPEPLPPIGQEPIAIEPIPERVPARRKRSFWGRYPFSNYYDSQHAFDLLGVKVLSDLDLETRPCDGRIRMQYILKGSRFGVQRHQPGGAIAEPVFAEREDAMVPNQIGGQEQLELRDYFPETFLWDLYVVGPRGEVNVEKAVPHTITTWIGSSFCSNVNSGLGVSPSVSLTVFQPFFASFNLPYSVIRGERIPISVSVFNYLSECLAIKVTLTQESWFEMVGSTAEQNICVCGGQKETPTFYIRPLQLGSLNLTVEAEVTDEAGICGNDLQVNTAYLGLKDAVRRPLLVEPEGKEEEYARSLFVCPTDADGETGVLDLSLPPEGLVPDSARGYFTVIGDVMGPALNGLDKLLRMPYGCGEQNMLNFAPNIFIMQYLTGTNQANSEIETNAKQFMTAGYQRELNYRRTDGSYSAFGNSDPEGSMWLTAFVSKSFAQARPFIFIDQVDLDKSITWFKSQQLENGCFPARGRVIHKEMLGGLTGEGSPAVLTAYVLIAMIEAGTSKEDPAVMDAVLCLKAQTVNDTYSIALMTYAMSLYDTAAPFRVELIDILDRRAILEDGKTYWRQGSAAPAPPPPIIGGWRRPYQAPSADVEITAYVLLSKLADGGAGVIGKALPIVKWLTSQRNENGGFASTQDTVVGLQALAQYATLVYGKSTNINVMVSGIGISETISVDSTNSLLLHKKSVQVPNSLTVTTTGTGCVFVQASVRYNVLNMVNGREAAFSLTVSSKREIEGANQCRFRYLEICARYNLADKVSNMAVISAKMQTGWIPVKDSLYDLKKDTTLKLKRFELDNNWLNFYFDQLSGDYTCFVMKVEQDLIVGDLKPSVVKVFDYYDKEKLAEATYELKTTCGTKEEIPFNLNEAADPNNLGQQREPVGGFPGGPVVKVGENNDDCPVCLEAKPDDLQQMFCAATKAYRLDVRPTRRYPLKARKEMRQGGIDHVHISLKYNLKDGCQCPCLNESGRILVLTKETDIESVRRRKRANRYRGKLNLAKDITIIPMGGDYREIERELRRYRTKNCP